MANHWKYWDEDGEHEWVAHATLPRGTDLFKVAFLNQFVDAINERVAAFNAGRPQNSLDYSALLIPVVVVGDDVQLASLYNSWMDRIKSLFTTSEDCGWITVDYLPGAYSWFDPYWTSNTGPMQLGSPDIDDLSWDTIASYHLTLCAGDEITPTIFENIRTMLERMRVTWSFAGLADGTVSGIRWMFGTYYFNAKLNDYVWEDFESPSDPSAYPRTAWEERGYEASWDEEGQYPRWRYTLRIMYTVNLRARVNLAIGSTQTWTTSFFAVNWWWWWFNAWIPHDWAGIGYNLSRVSCTPLPLLPQGLQGQGPWAQDYSNPLGSSSDNPPGIHSFEGTEGVNKSMGSDIVQFVKLNMIYE